MHHCLDELVCGAALALDDVAREGPGRPDEAKDCGTISHFCPQESEGLSHKLDLHERRHTRNDVGIAAPHRTSRQNDDAPGLYLFKVYVVELVHLVGVGEGLINQRAFVVVYLHLDAECRKRRQDVAEENDAVRLEGVPWLQADFRDEVHVL